MRIGTYNVYGFRGFPSEEADKSLGAGVGAERVAHFAQVVGELQCDVLALQEGGAPPVMMQEIAQRNGAYLATIPSPRHWPGQVLSRLAIEESRVLSHFDPGTETPLLSRSAGLVRLRLDAGRTIWLVALHLHPSDRALREREAAIVARALDTLGDHGGGTVVLGDFNCNVDEALHERLRERNFVNAMEAAGGGLRPTIDTFGKRTHTIDHIYVSPALAGTLRRTWVMRSPGFRHDGPQAPGVWVHSDHLPVVAEFDL